MSERLPLPSRIQDVNVWCYFYAKPGSPLIRMYILETSRITQKVRLVSNPNLPTADGPWHGTHNFQYREAIDYSGRTDPILRSDFDWQLSVSYPGETGKLVQLRRLPLMWVWRRTGSICYQGFVRNDNNGDYESLRHDEE